MSEEIRENVKSMLEFWIRDGMTKTYDVRAEIGAMKNATYDKSHKSWVISRPSTEQKELLKSMGLKIQFRRIL